ncbi:MAG: hypothetical protein RMJ66_03235 [Bacteroidia bacterium]|nr:hypothetical protein [Bacteroidia bacterium]MDW8134059.1 hypothetical protein [Bacteroidia bacterium]
MAIGWAQQSIRDSAIHFLIASVTYGSYWPSADLAHRFGWSSVVGGEIAYKFKNHLYIGLQGGGLIGDKVVEQGLLEGLYLSSLYTAGVIGFVDETGKIFTPKFQQRGWNASLRLGWILPSFRLPKQNPNCGPFVEVGIGYLSHRIHIDKARSERLPLLEGEYLKGFDRLTGGWGLSETIGYRFFSSRNLINFFIAAEMAQYFTRSLRGYIYDQAQRDSKKRKDFWHGLRIGWSLLLYEKAPPE